MKNKISEKTICWIVVLICSLCYISLVWNTNVWMDEAFTATLANHSFAEVIYLSMKDTLPPLYNILLKITTSIFGYHIYVMKLTSVVPMILTMILGATTVRARHGLVTAVSFILSITGMPLMLYYGVEIRMYSLGFLFATASGIYVYEVIVEPSRKNWVLFTIFSVLAGYSHHFAFVAVGFVYGCLLLHFIFGDRKRLKSFFICLFGTFILYFPCMLVTLKQLGNVSGYFSMPDVTLQLFIQYVLYPYMVGILPASILCLLLVFALLIFWLFRFAKNTDRSASAIYAICCFLIYYGVLMFGTVISKIMTANIFVDRYLFFSTGLLWMFTAIMIGKLSERLQKIALLILLMIGICSFIVEWRVEYTNSADEEIAFLNENIGEGDMLYACGGHEELENCLPFYSMLNNGNKLNYTCPLDNALETSKLSGRTLWIAVLDGYEPTAEELAMIDNAGFVMEKVADFDFDRYKSAFYRLDKAD